MKVASTPTTPPSEHNSNGEDAAGYEDTKDPTSLTVEIGGQMIRWGITCGSEGTQSGA